MPVMSTHPIAKRVLSSELSAFQTDSMSSLERMAMAMPTTSSSSKASPMAAKTRSCHILPSTLAFFLILRIQQPPWGNASHMGAQLGWSRNMYRFTSRLSCDGRFTWM
jgi:hypothetical protein